MRDDVDADVGLKLFFEGEDFDWPKSCPVAIAA